MTQDSRRYHRVRGPRMARAYGLLGAVGSGLSTAGSAIGSGLEAAGGAVGSGLESALGSTGSTALQGLSSVGQGLQSLFAGGGGTEAGHLASLGQAVPAGVELAGPSATFAGPGFLQSVAQGFVHGPQQLAAPSAATSLGQGVGGLLSALDQLNAQRQGGMSMQPIVGGITGEAQKPRYLPSAPAQPGQGNIMKMIGQILAAV